MTRTVRLNLTIVLALPLSGGTAAEAYRGGARTNVNRNVNVNQNVNVNRNVHRDVDVHRDRDVDVHVHGGYHGCCYHSVGTAVATAAAVTATAVVTAAVVGSIVHTVPPSCTAVVVNGITYQQCGSAWYQPQYSGTTVQYIVVNPPR